MPCYANHCPIRFPALSTAIFLAAARRSTAAASQPPLHIRMSMIARCLISTSQSLRRASYFCR